jgi:hypothetical protein
MGKFSQYEVTVRKPKAPWRIHPIWRGIGCLMMIIISGISYAGSVILVDANLKNSWLPFPREFYGPPGNPLLYAQIGVTVLLSILGYLIFVIFYTLIYRLIGPPPLGPTDAPPIKITGKRKPRKSR